MKKEKTRLVIQYDAGFPNSIYVRGEGIPGLTWQKGVPLKNIKANEWELEIEKSFTKGEFKVLINDVTYEIGENHLVKPGASIRINPKFPI